MGKFKRTVKCYVKNGKRCMDVDLGQGQGIITLSSTEIYKKMKKKPKGW